MDVYVNIYILILDNGIKYDSNFNLEHGSHIAAFQLILFMWASS